MSRPVCWWLPYQLAAPPSHHGPIGWKRVSCLINYHLIKYTRWPLFIPHCFHVHLPLPLRSLFPLASAPVIHRSPAHYIAANCITCKSWMAMNCASASCLETGAVSCIAEWFCNCNGLELISKSKIQIKGVTMIIFAIMRSRFWLDLPTLGDTMLALLLELDNRRWYNSMLC